MRTCNPLGNFLVAATLAGLCLCSIIRTTSPTPSRYEVLDLPNSWLIWHSDNSGAYISIRKNEYSADAIAKFYPADRVLIKEIDSCGERGARACRACFLAVMPTLEAVDDDISLSEWLQATGFSGESETELIKWTDRLRQGAPFTALFICLGDDPEETSGDSPETIYYDEPIPLHVWDEISEIQNSRLPREDHLDDLYASEKGNREGDHKTGNGIFLQGP